MFVFPARRGKLRLDFWPLSLPGNYLLSAQSYRLTEYGKAVCRVLTNRGTGISIIGELHLTYGENDGSKD